MMFALALYVGNAACAACHPAIYRSYSATPMARSSGIVNNNIVPGAFRHQPSRVDYTIESSGLVRLQRGAARGERRLQYFIGSGAAGRSFLVANGGFLFEAPVTWYSQISKWDASPGYERDSISRWDRAIEPSCLFCHASQPRVIADAQNGYGDPPFTQDGIGCERCHGPGSEHVQGKGVLVIPAKLDAARREAVCAQCHLTGEVRVLKSEKQLSDYRPGGLLSDYAAYFVKESASALKATSHMEKLYASRCRMASGDRLWCGTCHDPHVVPAVSERAAWYRQKCQGCHEPSQCRRGDDCIACHMPRQRVVDGGHGVLTDHSIPRKPASALTRAEDSWRLRPFAGFAATDRELGLAYAELCLLTGDRRQQQEAMRLLNAVAPDAEVELRLADLYQRQGSTARAQALYESALRRGGNQVVALVNLGGIYGASGRLDEAIALWRRALKQNPCLPEARANLAAASALPKDENACRF